jgi:hypothetical protein
VVDWEVESGLGGRLETREVPLGGRGKAPMLVTLRRVLGTAVRAGLELVEYDDRVVPPWRVGTEGVELALMVLGVRRPVSGTERADAEVAVRLGVEVGSMEVLATEMRREASSRSSQRSSD